MNRTIRIAVCLLGLSIPSPESYSADLITLKAGDIFLGDIVDEKDSRYHFERYGFISVIPTWEVKTIEKNQSRLPMSTVPTPFQDTTPYATKKIPSVISISKQITPRNATDPESLPILWNLDNPKQKNVRMFDLLGKTIPVVSAPPAEPSHLELYPKQSHFWVPQNRYLRGYLANQTERAYRSLKLQITYYMELPGVIGSATQPHTDFRQQTEIFKVYSQTMKPFIVDTHFVEWEKLKRIDFQIIERVPMALP